MFSTKQSDIFYNDETKQMFVCTVSSVSADRCDGTSETVYGAVPLIYKIDKATNYKSRVYPKDLTSFSLSSNSDLFAVTPTCPEGTNFDSITKPLINYNKTTSRYSVTFLGRYTSDSEGLGLNNYIFQEVDSVFHLLDSKIYIPKDKFTDDQFTFENGYLNSDLYIAGNTVRNGKPSWFNPDSGSTIERSPDYSIAPMHVQATSSLGFNLILDNKNVEIDALSGDAAFPMLYSGGFVTYNPKYVAFDPEYTIRVDFRARSFTVPSPTAYGGTQSVGTSATRWVQQWSPDAQPGEGFSISFFKNPENNSFVIPNGIGSTLGYAKADFSSNEVAGTAQSTVGLFKRTNWNPNTGIYGTTGNVGNVGSGNIGENNHGYPADSFLGVGFDIGGNFASTSEDKPGWFDGTSYTATPCSVGIRGSKFHNTEVLTSVAMSAVGNTVPMHTSAADAQFVDYRVDLSNRGNKVTVYNKLTSATDYNTILEFRLNVGVGTSNDTGEKYTPWEGIASDRQINENTLPPLNVGLSFTTSDKAANFELHKFEVTGVKVHSPWLKKEQQKPEVTTKIDYLQESSKNLRKKLVNVESKDLVDIEMIVPAKKAIAKSLAEENNTAEITLCDGNNPEVIEEDVDIKITKINPNQVDRAIQQVTAQGSSPKIPQSPTTIKKSEGSIDEGRATAAEPVIKDGYSFLITGVFQYCRSRIAQKVNTAMHAANQPKMVQVGKAEYPQYWYYKTNAIKIKNKTYYIWFDGIEHDKTSTNKKDTRNILKDNRKKLENLFLQLVTETPDQTNWILRVDKGDNIGYTPFTQEQTAADHGGTGVWPTFYSEDVDDWRFVNTLKPDEEDEIIKVCVPFDEDKDGTEIPNWSIFVNEDNINLDNLPEGEYIP